MTIIKQKFSGDQQFIPSRVSFLPLAGNFLQMFVEFDEKFDVSFDNVSFDSLNELCPNKKPSSVKKTFMWTKAEKTEDFKEPKNVVVKATGSIKIDHIDHVLSIFEKFGRV